MQAPQNKKDRVFWDKNSFGCKCDLNDSENEITWLKQIATVVEAVSQPMCYSVLLSRDDAVTPSKIKWELWDEAGKIWSEIIVCKVVLRDSDKMYLDFTVPEMWGSS